MKVVGVIPARYKSSRFEGKPLADIHGYPMIWWVYQNVSKVKEFAEVYVATDSEYINDACKRLGLASVMTSEQHLTGTDRVAEFAENVKADIYVNVQGDEPLLCPEIIRRVISPFEHDEEIMVTNLMTQIKDPVEVVNYTVPKVIVNKDNIGVFLTRSPVPYPKGALNYRYYKQIGVYGYRPKALSFFGEFGKKHGKEKIEEIEDIEILRFIENGFKIQYVEVESASVAVDTVKDLEKVRKIIGANYE